MILRDGLFLQARDELMQRFATMAQTVLFNGVELGGGFSLRRQKKMRVVAEPMLTTWGIDDFPMPDAFRDEGLRVVRMTHENQHAVIPGRSIMNAMQIGDEVVVVALVAVLGAVFRRIAGRMNAGSTMQGGDT